MPQSETKQHSGFRAPDFSATGKRATAPSWSIMGRDEVSALQQNGRDVQSNVVEGDLAYKFLQKVSASGDLAGVVTFA